VPLGTYTGWNIRKSGFSEGDSCDLTGAFIPFSKTKVDRDVHDPRPSLAERYPTHADYVTKVIKAANLLVGQRPTAPARRRFDHLESQCRRRPLGRRSRGSYRSWPKIRRPGSRLRAFAG
jgi:hypothetical protein